MSRMVPLRHAARVLAAGVGPGACIGAAYILRPATIRLDAASSGQVHRPRLPSTKISPKAVQQISSGSLSGFCAGLVVALFSRTLVFLGASLGLAVYLASRYGVDLPQILGVKRLLNQSSWWKKAEGSPWFTSSFAVTFALAAFVRL